MASALLDPVERELVEFGRGRRAARAKVRVAARRRLRATDAESGVAGLPARPGRRRAVAELRRTQVAADRAPPAPAGRADDRVAAAGHPDAVTRHGKPPGWAA